MYIVPIPNRYSTKLILFLENILLFLLSSASNNNLALGIYIILCISCKVTRLVSLLYTPARLYIGTIIIYTPLPRPLAVSNLLSSEQRYLHNYYVPKTLNIPSYNISI